MEVLPDVDSAARRAAALIAREARASVALRGRALLATSGGSTPWRMLARLAEEDVPWANVHLFQVDERLVPAGHPDRILVHLNENLLSRVQLPEGHFHAMPVEEADLDGAAARYAAGLRTVAGDPAILDLVHLGLGTDGHTASLVPGDPVLAVDDVDVSPTGPYQGYRRMTLTFPVLHRARRILWLVTGADKTAILDSLRRGDDSIPASRIPGDRALIVADAAAAGTRSRP